MNRLEEIRERLGAATPGPWFAQPGYVMCTQGATHPEVCFEGDPGLPAEANLRLIAHAPADLAALLAVAEAARPFARCYAPITDEDAQRIVGPCGTCWGCQLRAALAPLTEEENRGMG